MGDDIDELEADELVTLAMLAFIHMHDKTPMPKEELLVDIITWFRMMTFDADLEVTEVEDNAVGYLNKDKGLH